MHMTCGSLSRLPFHKNHSPPENPHRTHVPEWQITHRHSKRLSLHLRTIGSERYFHPSQFVTLRVPASRANWRIMERMELSCAARAVNQSLHQVGRAWVARHGMSTYKDTTPHIPFRTGPPSSKHKDGRPSRSVPSLFSCLCRRGTPVTARARKRIRMLRWIAPCIPRSSSVGEPKRALGRAIHLNLRLPACYSKKLPLTLPRFSGPPSTL